MLHPFSKQAKHSQKAESFVLILKLRCRPSLALQKKQGKYANLLRPLEKQMRIRVPERRSQLLYSDTAFYPNGREKALTALDRQKEERRLELHRRKNLGEERIVGKHIMPRVGMKVMYSFEAVDNHRRPATEGLQGVISAVDDDMLMCSVIWPESEEKDDDDDDDDDPAATGDKEEYCCTGYNNMYDSIHLPPPPPPIPFPRLISGVYLCCECDMYWATSLAPNLADPLRIVSNIITLGLECLCG
jgi:hypothetical protein